MTVVLLSGLQIGQILLAFLCFAPNAPIEDAHDSDRSVECGDGRPECDVIVGLDELDETFICRPMMDRHQDMFSYCMGASNTKLVALVIVYSWASE